MSEGQHYFSTNPKADHDPGELVLEVGRQRLVMQTDAGVFSKSRVDRGTRLLLEALEKETVDLPPTGKLCDLGCGYGPLGLAMAVMRPKCEIYMVDINERAAKLSQENARRNNLPNVTVAIGSGLAPFSGTRFDLILSNPPLRTGKENVRGLLTEAREALHPGGRLAIVIRTQQGARSMERFLEQLFGTVREAEKGGGFRVYEATRA